MPSATYSARYDSAGNPINGRPFSAPGGGTAYDAVSDTVPTTELGEAGDVRYLIPVLCGKTLLELDKASSGDGDTGTALDADIMLRTTSAAGVNTDTMIWDLGAEFQAAVTTSKKKQLADIKVPYSASGFGHIILKVVTAATTAAALAIELSVKSR